MLRLNRLTSILIQLQSKRVIKAQEIADRFEISLRTVYRDIKTLEDAGVPILSEAGIGYSILKSYHLPPVHFSEQEALSFITAEKLVGQMADIQTKKSFESALFKIKSVLKSTEKELIDDAAIHIEVLSNEYLPKDRNHQLNIQEILDAILKKKIIDIDYFNGSRFENNKREIEPIGIFSKRDNWYLIAWCRLRQDYRNFRVDRINKLIILNDRFTKKHPSLHKFLKQTQTEQNLSKIVIRVDKESYRYLGDQQYYMGFVSQKNLGTQIEMTFLNSSLEGFAHWFLFFGSAADIIEPDALKYQVLHLIESTKIRLNK